MPGFMSKLGKALGAPLRALPGGSKLAAKSMSIAPGGKKIAQNLGLGSKKQSPMGPSPKMMGQQPVPLNPQLGQPPMGANDGGMLQPQVMPGGESGGPIMGGPDIPGIGSQGNQATTIAHPDVLRRKMMGGMGMGQMGPRMGKLQQMMQRMQMRQPQMHKGGMMMPQLPPMQQPQMPQPQMGPEEPVMRYMQ